MGSEDPVIGRLRVGIIGAALGVEAALRARGSWSDTPPPPEAFQSHVAFFADTLGFDQWLQHVLLARVREIDGVGGCFPESEVAAYATRELDGDPDADPLLDALRRFDDAIEAWRDVVLAPARFSADVALPPGPPPRLALETADALWFSREVEPPALIRLVNGRLEEIACGGVPTPLGADAATAFWAVAVPASQPQAGRALPIAARASGTPIVVAGPADRWHAFPTGGTWALVSEDAGMRRGFLQVGSGWITYDLAPDAPPSPPAPLGEGWVVAGFAGGANTAAFAVLDGAGAILASAPAPADRSAIAAVQGDRVWLWRGTQALALWSTANGAITQIGEWAVSSPVIAAGEGVVTLGEAGGLLALAPDGRATALHPEVPAGALLVRVGDAVLWTDGDRAALVDARTGARRAAATRVGAVLLHDGQRAWQLEGRVLRLWSETGVRAVELPFPGVLVSVHAGEALIHFPEQARYGLVGQDGAWRGRFTATSPALATGVFRASLCLWEDGRIRIR